MFKLYNCLGMPSGNSWFPLIFSLMLQPPEAHPVLFRWFPIVWTVRIVVGQRKLESPIPQAEFLFLSILSNEYKTLNHTNVQYHFNSKVKGHI